MRLIREQGIFNQIYRLLINRKKKEEKNLQFYLDLANRNPKDANHRLKLAEIYHKNGEEKKALSESLLAAENFCSSGHDRKGIAIYKKILKKQPYLDDVRLKMAYIYKEIGFLEEAFSQFLKLYEYYIHKGLKYKAGLNPLSWTDVLE